MGSLGFILACSPQACEGNKGRYISMRRQKTVCWEKIRLQRKHGEKVTDEKLGRSYHAFFFPFKMSLDSQRPLFVFFPFLISSRLQQTDFIRARCIGFDTK